MTAPRRIHEVDAADALLRAARDCASVELDSTTGTVTLHGVPHDLFVEVVAAVGMLRMRREGPGGG